MTLLWTLDLNQNTILHLGIQAFLLVYDMSKVECRVALYFQAAQ